MYVVKMGAVVVLGRVVVRLVDVLAVWTVLAGYVGAWELPVITVINA